MIKLYQVFVSSTYADLKEERSKVMRTIMELNCIPAGMELFPAIDEEQFTFIKSIIDYCDYYLLIIGGRYGSLSPDGLSYTEKEYDYAVEKGLKVIALIHRNPDDIPLGKSERSEDLRGKLEKFKTKVSASRIVKYWNSAEELPNLVFLSLSKTIQTYPAVGWVRPDAIGNELLLRILNERLNEKQVTSGPRNDLAEQLKSLLDVQIRRSANIITDFEKTLYRIDCTFYDIRNYFNYPLNFELYGPGYPVFTQEFKDGFFYGKEMNDSYTVSMNFSETKDILKGRALHFNIPVSPPQKEVSIRCDFKFYYYHNEIRTLKNITFKVIPGLSTLSDFIILQDKEI